MIEEAQAFLAQAWLSCFHLLCSVHDGPQGQGRSHEGSCHEGRSSPVQVGHRERHDRGHRDQRVCLQAVVGQSCSCGNQGGEGHRQVHYPWLVHAEAQEQAGDEGWQEGGLREGGHGKSEASIQSCEGLLCGSVEEEHLSRQPAQVLEWTFHSRVVSAWESVCAVYIARCSEPGKKHQKK